MNQKIQGGCKDLECTHCRVGESKINQYLQKGVAIYLGESNLWNCWEITEEWDKWDCRARRQFRFSGLYHLFFVVKCFL